jgi:hypothetical protein
MMLMSASSDESSPLQPSQVLTASVAVLHRRGFEGIRAEPYFYATGHWRCNIFVSRPGGSTYHEHGNVLLGYSSSARWDYFQDGREQWDADSLADEFETRAAAYPGAKRADPGYAAWYREMLEATQNGTFIFFEDFWTPEHDWKTRGLVRLLPRGDAFVSGEVPTMPVPPSP